MRKLAIRLIEWYQKDISPYNNHKCRFTPSCSEYSKQSYMRFNVFKASWLTFWRILRCNPLSKGGYDPVPEKKQRKAKPTTKEKDPAPNCKDPDHQHIPKP
ncbi:MAG: membrane protein insertion efficiency factor YidD [Acholeplasmataceae bacterium]|nr:membrane protein insertion efficiency factor YidD [Acholeplasmataceae bacterium]